MFKCEYYQLSVGGVLLNVLLRYDDRSNAHRQTASTRDRLLSQYSKDATAYECADFS